MKFNGTVFIIFLFSVIYSQNKQSGIKLITAIKTNISPEIDGNIIDDPVWQKINPVTGFTQKTPDEGEPATEKTIVKIAIAKDYFYLAAV